MTRSRMMLVSACCATATFAVTMVTVLAITRGQAQRMDDNEAAAIGQGSPAGGGPNLRETNDVRVHKQAERAVVNISTSRKVIVQRGVDIFMRPLVQSVQVQSLGSGFVIHPAGYIITNQHVVEAATDVKCVFAGGESLTAQVIATDNEHDLAVLKVTPGEPLHALELGTSEDLMIGEPVYAIGNPFGFKGTMTKGIVSAVDRSLEVSPTQIYRGLIQTDASINPGNSGGPLLNAYGQVVGVNTAIRQGAEGISFAISVSNMRDLLPAFLRPEALNRTRIGFEVEEKRTMLPPNKISSAVLVREVHGAEAEKVGLKVGDQLVKIDGEAVVNVVDALVDLGSARGGRALALEVMRAGKLQRLEVPVAVVPPPPSPEEIVLAKMGVRGETITPAIAERYGLPYGQGVYVSLIEPNSPATKVEFPRAITANPGLNPRDLIFQLGNLRIASIEDLAMMLSTVNGPVTGNIQVIRGTSILPGTIPLK